MNRLKDRAIELLKSNEGDVLTYEELCRDLKTTKGSLKTTIKNARKECDHIYNCHGVGFVYDSDGDPYKI